METNLAVVNDEGNFMVKDSGKNTFCSWKPETLEEKTALFNSVNNPTSKLREMVNVPISLKHVFAERCEYVSDDGVVTPGVRMVLLDTEGKAYSSSSIGVFNGLQKLFSLCGTPDEWEVPITIVPRIIDRGVNKAVVTFDIK